MTGVNWIEYCGGPPPKLVSGLKAVWPDGKWSCIDHGRRYPTFAGLKKEDAMPIPSTTSVWNEGHLTQYQKWDGKSPGPRGFKRGTRWSFPLPTIIDEPKMAICGEGRDQYRESCSLLFLRLMNEEMLMRGQHGIDPFGVELWPINDEKDPVVRGLWNFAAQGPSHAFVAILAPAPDGPVPTERFEALREGVQIAEAMLFLQRALDDKKIDGDLADRANKTLDGRAWPQVQAWKTCEAAQKEATAAKRPFNTQERYLAEISAGARDRDAELYTVCGEVAKAVTAKQ